MGGAGVSHIATSAVPLKFDVGAEDDVFRKITLRLIPFLFLCYLAAYLDRVNVGFAKLQMQKESHGERVEKPEDLPGAIERALANARLWSMR
jgi:hypothetical protein